MGDRREPGWEAASWEGSRRERLRRGLRLIPRGRLEAMAALADTAERLAGSPESMAGETPATDGNGDPVGRGKG